MSPWPNRLVSRLGPIYIDISGASKYVHVSLQEADEIVCWPMTGSGEIIIFEHHNDGGPDHYAARVIKSNGQFGGGDWQSLMLVQKAQLNEYHEYSVEWVGDDAIFRLGAMEVY
jgi:hypothetical protein